MNSADISSFVEAETLFAMVVRSSRSSIIRESNTSASFLHSLVPKHEALFDLLRHHTLTPVISSFLVHLLTFVALSDPSPATAFSIITLFLTNPLPSTPISTNTISDLYRIFSYHFQDAFTNLMCKKRLPDLSISGKKAKLRLLNDQLRFYSPAVPPSSRSFSSLHHATLASRYLSLLYPPSNIDKITIDEARSYVSFHREATTSLISILSPPESGFGVKFAPPPSLVFYLLTLRSLIQLYTASMVLLGSFETSSQSLESPASVVLLSQLTALSRIGILFSTPPLFSPLAPCSHYQSHQLSPFTRIFENMGLGCFWT